MAVSLSAMDVFVVARMDSSGTLMGDLLRRHPGSRATGIPLPYPGTGRIDFLTLVEGVPHHAVAQLLLAWNLRYGHPAEVLGDPFALRLPVIPAVGSPSIERLLLAGESLAVAGSVAEGAWVEQWIRCADLAEAQRLVARLRGLLGPAAVQLAIAGPRQQELDCWQVLRDAAAMVQARGEGAAASSGAELAAA